MSQYLSVSEVARRLDACPRDISDLFYRRALRDDLCPIVGGRRLIPESYILEIERALRRHGKAPGTTTTGRRALPWEVRP